MKLTPPAETPSPANVLNRAIERVNVDSEHPSWSVSYTANNLRMIVLPDSPPLTRCLRILWTLNTHFAPRNDHFCRIVAARRGATYSRVNNDHGVIMD
jgi:hypothetical protein